MKKVLLIFLVCKISLTSHAQKPSDAYFDLVKKADSLYNAKSYKTSAFTYSEAFKANGWKAMMNDRYNAACSWALAGYADSAFFNLERVANLMNYMNYNHVKSDGDLVSLYNDKRWQPFLTKVKENKEKAEVNLNKPLVAQLDSIHDEDQIYRKQLDGMEEKYGRQSKEIREHWKIIKYKDSINLIKVKAILDKYGWLGPDVVGGQGNSTLFLVIQHADLKTQEKYLPIMREAVKNEKAQPSSLALLEDRVLMRNGKKQLYGSQIGFNQKTNSYYVAALEDPDNVDKRRASMNLGSLADYVKTWKIIWDVEAYKKLLPELEKDLEKNKY
jgi:hypothetical protein